MRFPYLRRGRHAYPIVPITLSYQGRSLRTEGLLDSGANLSLFPAEIAEYLGLSLESGRPIYLSGIGGRILGYRHQVSLAVETTAFQATIVFSAEFISSFNILGRDNFFKKFRITFNERQRFVEIEETGGPVVYG
jgi:hypothetical protein